MRDDLRIAEFAEHQNVTQFVRPRPLSRPSAVNYSGPNDRNAAKTKLLQVRRNSTSYKDPAKGLRASLKLRNKGDIDKINSTFSLNERRDAFDEILQSQEPVGIAQAVIDFHPNERFDVNIRKEASSKSPFKKRNSSNESNVTFSRWLQIATDRGQKDYVALLAGHNARQESLDESLQIALNRSSLPLVEILLRNGANPNFCKDEFHRLVSVGDGSMEFTGLLLNSSIHPISQKDRDRALIVAVQESSFALVNQLLTFGADPNKFSGHAFTSAASALNIRLLTLLVRRSNHIAPESLQDAIDHICECVDIEHQIRRTFLDLLLSAGARTRPQIATALLVCSVEDHDTDLVSLLVRHGEILSEQATKAMYHIPHESTMEEVLVMSRLLFEADAEGQKLGEFLVWAVVQNYRPVIALLVEHGVSLDHDDAMAVNFALQKQDIPLLQLLLNGESAESGKSTHDQVILAKTLKTALAIGDKRRRHLAVDLLLNKGLEGPALDIALQDVVAKPAIRDRRLIRALIEAGADVNCNDAQCVKSALSLPENDILRDICSTGQISRTSFENLLLLVIERCREDQSKARILLGPYADFDDEICKALVQEVKSGGGQEEIVRLLLENGGSVNFRDGIVLEDAISITPETKAINRVRLFLSMGPNETTLDTAFNAARRLHCTVQHRLDLFNTILEANYRGEGIHKALVESVTMQADDILIPTHLLLYGASVDYENGQALNLAVKFGNLALMATLMGHNPSIPTIRRAFESASQGEMKMLQRTEIYKCLLRSGKVPGDSVTSALTSEIIHGRTDVTILDLLIHHGGFLGRGALCHLVKTRNSATMSLLLQSQTPSKDARSQAFQYCFELERSQRLEFAKLLIPSGIESGVWNSALQRAILDRDPRLLKLVLKHRTGQNFKIGETLVVAADTLDPEIINIILQNGPSSQARDRAFGRMLESGKMEHTMDSRRAATLILVQGISQTLKDRALVYCLGTLDRHKSDFYKTLIQNNANVNAEGCQCFIHAGELEDLSVFQFLLTSKPNFDQVINALVSRFSGQYSRLVELLGLTLTSEYCSRNLPSVQVVLDAMNRYPRGHELIRLLLDHDYPAGDLIELPGGVDGLVEAVTPLIWALSQPRPGISDSVIEELLKEGEKARPEYVTDRMNITAILLASQYGRHRIIARLVQMKVDVSVTDCFDKSPLFYAISSDCANEDGRCVALLQAQAQLDDGSLHEAARLFQPGIVVGLLDEGHAIDYPSKLHGGRTPLGELCLRGDVCNRSLESKAYRTMQVLISSDMDLTKRIEGKTVLHLALDNNRPVEVTKVLLRFKEIWKDIQTDSETFLYEDARGISMSPDLYVREYCNCSERMKRELLELLKNSQCKSKWFKKRGQQVADPQGLPPAMLEIQQREDLADQQALRAIERQRMQARANLDIDRAQHKERLKQNKELNTADMTNRQLQHQQALQHDNALSTQRRYNASLERTEQTNHANQMAQIEYRALENRNNLQYNALEREADLQRKTLTDKEAVEQRMHDREMRRMQRAQENIKLAAREQRQLIEASKAARLDGPAPMKMLDWDQPD